MKILIPGGAGLIGSAVVRQCIAQAEHQVVNLDKLTYAGNPESVGIAVDCRRHCLTPVDIAARAELERLFAEHCAEAAPHIGPGSRVDSSISSCAEFIESNIVASYTLLGATRSYRRELPWPLKASFCFFPSPATRPMAILEGPER